MAIKQFVSIPKCIISDSLHDQGSPKQYIIDIDKQEAHRPYGSPKNISKQ